MRVSFTYHNVRYIVQQFFMLDGAPAVLGISASGRSVVSAPVTAVSFTQ